MAINVPAIVELIAHRPKIRTVEIADIIDCDPDHVQPALQKCIDAGDIVVHPVTAPNGKPANGFECSERFKRTDLHKAFMKTAPAPDPEKTDIAVPISTKRKGELGIDCIKANCGAATNKQVRDALGLRNDQFPAAWMSLDVERGAVHYDGKFWRLGRKPIAQPAAVVTPKHHVPEARKAIEPELMVAMPITDAGDVRPGEMTLVQRIPDMGIPPSKAPETATELGKTATIPGKSETLADSPAPALLELDPVHLHGLPIADAPSPPASAARTVYDPDRYAQEFACSVWSNGGIQVRRFGIDVAIFTPAEVKILRRFVNSTLAAA